VNELVAIVALFGAGITATLSPCVLPLVPGIVGVLAGAADAGRRVRSMAAFAAGAISVFAVLGVAVGGLGAVGVGLGSDLQRVAGVVLVVLAVVWFAAQRGIAVPSARLIRTLPDAPVARAFVLGVGCGAAWTPCAGPLLGAALTAAGAASGTGGIARSTVLLVSYAAGVLVPFVALAALGLRRVPELFRTAGRVLAPLSAVVMLVLGVALATGWYELLVSRLVA
jgi:cytochrome c-type biogenesis protein